VLVPGKGVLRRRRAARGTRSVWLGFIIPILLTILAVFGITTVSSHADKRRQGQILLARLSANANRQRVLVSGVSGLGIVVKDESNPSFERSLDDLPRGIEGLADQIDADLKSLQELSPPEMELATVAARSEAYQKVLERQVMLLEDRQFGEAWSFDRQRIQPAFNHLRINVKEADEAYRQLAESANSQANWGTAAILAVTVLVLGYLQFERSRRERDLLMAEQRIIKDSEERFRSLVQNSSDVISITGEDLIARYNSPAIEALLGIHPDAGVGVSIKEFVRDEDVSLFQMMCGEVMTEPGATSSLECRMRHADGSARDVEIWVTNSLGAPNLAGLVFNVRDITERKEAERERAALEQQLAYQAFHDPLTGLANRVLFKDRIDHALARCARNKEEIAVLFLDLDNFKSANDTLGHDAGDCMLKAVADRLQACLRDSDTIARFGGDEFSILLEGIDDEGTVYVVAERLVESMTQPFDLNDRQVLSSASVGVAFSGLRGEGAEELLANADVAMYAAKSQGKGCIETYRPDMRRSLIKRMDLETGLRRAVRDGEFILQYQPIVDVVDGRVTGLEALVRWNDPERGMIPPGEFIPLAEETGLILPMGKWVLEQACAQGSAWRSKYADFDLKISVNISGRQFQQPTFVSEVADVLRVTQLSPSSLVLELTESILVQDSTTAVRKIGELKELGVQLALDDFGTGYSSLNYLRAFPIDVLKIDKSFIDGVAKGAEESALARAIVQIGETLSLRTVAEGIESEEQATELRSLGCVEGQGFFFARPLDLDAVEALLEDRVPAAVNSA
jgi:diguanylate cyclase (GGDEF)-like protein/PAS domain S-box-containing protein